MLHWWCSLFVFITVDEEESFRVKSFLQTWSLTLKINSEQRLVGGHCKQTLLNKTRGNFTMESRSCQNGAHFVATDGCKSHQGDVKQSYQQLFWVFLFDCCKVPNISTAKNIRPWCHDVMWFLCVMMSCTLLL